MELVDGDTLHSHLLRHASPGGGLPTADVIAIARQIVRRPRRRARERASLHRDLQAGQHQADRRRRGEGPRLRPGRGASWPPNPVRIRPADAHAVAGRDRTQCGDGHGAYMSPEQARGWHSIGAPTRSAAATRCWPQPAFARSIRRPTRPTVLPARWSHWSALPGTHRWRCVSGGAVAYRDSHQARLRDSPRPSCTWTRPDAVVGGDLGRARRRRPCGACRRVAPGALCQQRGAGTRRRRVGRDLRRCSTRSAAVDSVVPAADVPPRHDPHRALRARLPDRALRRAVGR